MVFISEDDHELVFDTDFVHRISKIQNSGRLFADGTRAMLTQVSITYVQCTSLGVRCEDF